MNNFDEITKDFVKWLDTLDEDSIIRIQQKEIERLNNIINKALGIANERINYCYHQNDKEQLESWEEIFDILRGSDKE